MRKRYPKLTPAAWAAKIRAAQELAVPCRLCPRQCQVDRHTSRGYCGQGPLAVAHIQDHGGEEPFLVGGHGSAAFFFAGCNLGCIYCQNWEISRGTLRKVQHLTPAALAAQFLAAQQRGCANINLVTPTIFLPDILVAIQGAAKQGLTLPIVYNTSSYESPAALALLENVVDIYLADLKYDDEKIAQLLSGAADYPCVAQQALAIMQEQVGGLVWQTALGRGPSAAGELAAAKQLRRGLVVRHLVLPGQVLAAQRIAHWVQSNLPQAYFSLLAQYDPPVCLLSQKVAPELAALHRRLTAAEYAAVWAAVKPGHRIGQELQAAASWTPHFAQAGADKFKGH